MSEWHKLIAAFHKIDHPDSPDSLVVGPPATEEAIAAFEQEIGYTMPDEFKELYRAHDGFGSVQDGETAWFFVPLAKLPEHVAEVRDWFQGTHPDIAKRYVPFVDWGSGDACGYVFSDGVAEPGIFMFEHETYEFEEDQDEIEFISPVGASIRDLLVE